MTAEELWTQFSQVCMPDSGEYSAWAFGGEPDLLAGLVLAGEKTATASAFPLYAYENEALPETGEYSVVLDSRDQAVCVIQTTKVYIVPFTEVTAEHAFKEGEGDKSLSYWRQVHQQFFSDCLKEDGMVFTPDMNVVCEEFKVVFPR